MRYTQDAKAITNFSVAISQGKDAQGKERPAKWFRVSCWNKLGEVCHQ